MGQILRPRIDLTPALGDRHLSQARRAFFWQVRHWASFDVCVCVCFFFMG
jgi:hypothetical protein